MENDLNNFRNILEIIITDIFSFLIILNCSITKIINIINRKFGIIKKSVIFFEVNSFKKSINKLNKNY